jgi:hypothetical protein
MTSLGILRKEHKTLEVELKELEALIGPEVDDVEGEEDEKEVNYPNLIHTIKRVVDFWNSHEDKEERFLKEIGDKYPELKFDTILFQHKELSGHKKIIMNAINAGNDFEIKVALDTDGRIIMDKIRRHMKEEDELFDKMQSQAK